MQKTDAIGNIKEWVLDTFKDHKTKDDSNFDKKGKPKEGEKNTEDSTSCSKTY